MPSAYPSPQQPASFTERRDSHRLPPDEFVAVVIFTSDTVYQAAVADESSSGIGIRVRPHEGAALQVGQQLEITHRGVAKRGEVRHVTPGEETYIVGLRWL